MAMLDVIRRGTPDPRTICGPACAPGWRSRMTWFACASRRWAGRGWRPWPPRSRRCGSCPIRWPSWPPRESCDVAGAASRAARVPDRRRRGGDDPGRTLRAARDRRRGVRAGARAADDAHAGAARGVGRLERALGAAPAGDGRRPVGRGARARPGVLRQRHARHPRRLVQLRASHRTVPAAGVLAALGLRGGPAQRGAGRGGRRAGRKPTPRAGAR